MVLFPHKAIAIILPFMNHDERCFRVNFLPNALLVKLANERDCKGERGGQIFFCRKVPMQIEEKTGVSVVICLRRFAYYEGVGFCRGLFFIFSPLTVYAYYTR